LYLAGPLWIPATVLNGPPCINKVLPTYLPTYLTKSKDRVKLTCAAGRISSMSAVVLNPASYAG